MPMKLTGSWKFEQLRLQAYDEIFDNIMDAVWQADKAGMTQLKIRRHPPRVMYILLDTFREEGFAADIVHLPGDRRPTLDLSWA